MAGWDGGVSSGSIGSFLELILIKVSWNLQLPNFEPSENSSDQRWSEFQSACDVRKCFRLVCAGGIPSRLLNDSWWSVSVDLLRFNLFEPQVVGSVLFSTARPYFGFPPAVSSEDPAMFFFVGGRWLQQMFKRRHNLYLPGCWVLFWDDPFRVPGLSCEVKKWQSGFVSFEETMNADITWLCDFNREECLF